MATSPAPASSPSRPSAEETVHACHVARAKKASSDEPSGLEYVFDDITVTCSCGNTIQTRSTTKTDTVSVDVCSACHPFYTGTQKIVDTAGRIDKFRRRYGT